MSILSSRTRKSEVTEILL